MSAQRLADRCGELGVPISRSILADLENGRRGNISVAELIVLARALDVAPFDLLTPDDGPVELLPGRFTSYPDAARWFATGLKMPLLEAIREQVAELSRMISATEGEDLR